MPCATVDARILQSAGCIHCGVVTLGCCSLDKLAKEQLHPAGPSQALLNCCDAVVDKLHLYGDVCIVDDRVYYDHSCRGAFF